MGISKVIFNNSSLIDLTQDTVTANDVRRGVSFHDACGDAGVGVMDQGEDPMYVPEHSFKVFFSNSKVDENIATRQLVYYARQNVDNLRQVENIIGEDIFPISKLTGLKNDSYLTMLYNNLNNLRIEIIGNNFITGNIFNYLNYFPNNLYCATPYVKDMVVYTENILFDGFSLTNLITLNGFGASNADHREISILQNSFTIQGKGGMITGLGAFCNQAISSTNLINYNYVCNQKNVEIYGELFFYNGQGSNVGYANVSSIKYRPFDEIIKDINNIEHINLYSQLPLCWYGASFINNNIDMKPHITFKSLNNYKHKWSNNIFKHKSLFYSPSESLWNNSPHIYRFNHLTFESNSSAFYFYSIYTNLNLINKFYANIMENGDFCRLNFYSNTMTSTLYMLNQLNNLLDQINYFDVCYLNHFNVSSSINLTNLNYTFNNHKNLTCFPGIIAGNLYLNNTNFIINEPYIIKTKNIAPTFWCATNSYCEINCQNLKNGEIKVPRLYSNGNCMINIPLFNGTIHSGFNAYYNSCLTINAPSYNGNGIRIEAIASNSSIYLDVPSLKNISSLFSSCRISDGNVTVNGICNVINATNTFYNFSIYYLNSCVNYTWIDDNIFTEHLISANGMFNNSNIRNGFIDRPLNLYKCKNYYI